MNYPTPGIHEGVPFDLYRADDITQADTLESVKGKAVSKSMLIEFDKDPKAWKVSERKKATAAMKGGSLFDCLLTDAGSFSDRYIVSEYPDFRSKEARLWKAEHEQAGLVVINEDDLDAAWGQKAAVMAHTDAAKLLEGALMQVAFRHETPYGFDNKGLVDVVPANSDCLVDIKTCEPRALESPRTLQNHIAKWAYHIQAGAYCDGWSTATGEDITQFKFIFVSSAKPFTVAVVAMPFRAILFGSDQYRAAMKRFHECLAADIWPGKWDNEIELDIPEYTYLGDGGEA